MDYRSIYQSKLTDLDHVLASIPSNVQISTSGCLCEPSSFLERFHEILPEREGIELLKGRSRDYPFFHLPDLKDHLTVLGHLYDATFRSCVPTGAISHMPGNLHEFMRNRVGYKPVDIFIAMATPMDENGRLAVSGCGMWESDAYTSAKRVILEVNPYLPKFRGSLTIPIDRVDMLYEAPKPPLEFQVTKTTPVDEQVGEMVASLVNDGDCVQIGLGGMPDAAGRAFMTKNDLGLHTELFTPVMADLLEAGVITGKYKNIDQGEHVGTFVMGDEHLYRTLENNPGVRFAPSSYTNSPYVIAQIDHFVSLNTCMEIDLTGQICSESIGPVQYSGVGGAFDFAYGAMHSEGGRSIMAMSSTAKNGTISKIKAELTPGSVITVPRTSADIVVTEYGIAYLRGRSVRERVHALIAIAHPAFRDELRSYAKRMYWI